MCIVPKTQLFTPPCSISNKIAGDFVSSAAALEVADADGGRADADAAADAGALSAATGCDAAAVALPAPPSPPPHERQSESEKSPPRRKARDRENMLGRMLGAVPSFGSDSVPALADARK